MKEYNGTTYPIKFPQGRIYLDSKKNAYLEYNQSAVNKFNNNGNKLQIFLDKKVATYLAEYVSYKTGTQAKSIILTSDYGSGYVKISVPYAHYQAYSKKIKKRVGKRGTQPFERMKADKSDTIARELAKYSRELHGNG